MFFTGWSRMDENDKRVQHIMYAQLSTCDHINPHTAAPRKISPTQFDRPIDPQLRVTKKKKSTGIFHIRAAHTPPTCVCSFLDFVNQKIPSSSIARNCVIVIELWKNPSHCFVGGLYNLLEVYINIHIGHLS